MAGITKYRQIIEEILNWYGSFQPNRGEEFERQVLFDREHDHYQVIDVGWDYPTRIHSVLLHLDIKDSKIWVQADNTDPGVVDRLIEHGVPKEDIVLAFHAPYKRPYTGFAVA
jgi:hypothetical protein